MLPSGLDCPDWASLEIWRGKTAANREQDPSSMHILIHKLEAFWVGKPTVLSSQTTGGGMTCRSVPQPLQVRCQCVSVLLACRRLLWGSQSARSCSPNGLHNQFVDFYLILNPITSREVPVGGAKGGSRAIVEVLVCVCACACVWVCECCPIELTEQFVLTGQFVFVLERDWKQ